MLPLLNQGGGAEKYFIELASRLSKEKNTEVEVITVDDSFFKFFALLLNVYKFKPFAGIDISGREKEEDVRKRLGGAKWIKSSFRALRKKLGQNDVVYSKNEIVDLLLLKIVGYKKLPSIVVGIHTPMFYPFVKSFNSKFHNFLYSGCLYRWLLKGTVLVHASNKFTADYVEKKFAAKTKLIPYPFSARKNQKKKIKEGIGKYYAPGKYNIIFSGRLGEQKGVDYLPKIAKRIFLNGLSEKVSLNIFGSGEVFWNENLKKLSREYSFVKYFGHIEQEIIFRILPKQDLLVSPSRWEVLPFNILEAQAAGLPVLAFDIPGPQDIVFDQKTGILVKSEQEFMESLINQIKNTKKFNRRTIKDNLERKFNPENIYKDIFQMFLEAKKPLIK